MNAVGYNITQSLFKENEKLVVPNDSFSTMYQNLKTLSDINSMPQNSTNMSDQMPIYLKLAGLSTWYQNNPWETLNYSKKFDLPILGGQVYEKNNIQVPNESRRENFENLVKGIANKPFNVKWQ